LNLQLIIKIIKKIIARNDCDKRTSKLNGFNPSKMNKPKNNTIEIEISLKDKK
jgi:hypothetical protein